MRMKLEQLKQLEAAYTEMQMLRRDSATEPGGGTLQQLPAMMSPAVEAGPQSQSEAIISGGWTHEPGPTVVDDGESSVFPSPHLRPDHDHPRTTGMSARLQWHYLIVHAPFPPVDSI